MTSLERKNLSRTALVTGGSNGIGYAIAGKMAQEGLRVIAADIVAPAEEPANLIWQQCNVTKGEDVDALYRWMEQNTGEPEIIVLNAGKGVHEQLAEGDPEKWQDVLDLNIMGVLRCIRAFVPPMLKRGRGDVVIISSVSADKPYTYGGVYSATKAAVEMIAETLRLETQPHIRVTVVRAGVTDTNFFDSREGSAKDLGMGSLAAHDIAEDIWYALTKRKDTVINIITTRPTGQAF